MRKVSPGILLLLFLFVVSCRPGDTVQDDIFVEDAEYVQIVLFHLAQRCESCIAVEKETKLLLEQEFEEEVASGKVKFISLNFQSEHGKNTAKLLKASGQTLLVVNGDRINNLTSSAFMFASIRPEQFRKALREALNKELD